MMLFGEEEVIKFLVGVLCGAAPQLGLKEPRPATLDAPTIPLFVLIKYLV